MSDNFERWIHEVNHWVMGYAGLGVDDLADAPFRDWHAAGEAPQEAAEQLLRDNGYPEELF